MLLYMYIAPGQGQTTPWGQMLMPTESPYHFAHLLQVLKQSLHVFSCFSTPGVKILMSTERPYHFDHLLQVLQKSLLTLILYIFLMFFSCVYSPSAGADNPVWTKFWSQQEGFITLTIRWIFKTINDFIKVFPIQTHIRPNLTLR